MHERDAFGPSLKAERDRRGIPLQVIADSTKIGISLLAALERNDVSRWPKGIFRRAFVREYVTALGLPPEPIVAEFVRLFPESPCSDVPESPCSAVLDVSELRLTLEAEPSATWKMLRVRLFVACVEVFGVSAMGLTLAWALGAESWKAIGMLALVYYPLASVFLERTPMPRLLVRPAGPARWFRTTSSSLRGAWPKPAARTPEGEDLEGSSTPAAEWHTASN
jgi:hypothetical protein